MTRLHRWLCAPLPADPRALTGRGLALFVLAEAALCAGAFAALVVVWACNCG